MPGATSSKYKLDFLEVTAGSIRMSAGYICHLNCKAEEEKTNIISRMFSQSGSKPSPCLLHHFIDTRPIGYDTVSDNLSQIEGEGLVQGVTKLNTQFFTLVMQKKSKRCIIFII